MSEYVLGRILPVFRGSYEVGTTYNKLDLVYVAGYGTYVAKTTVSSVQPESHPEIWQIVSKDITSQEVSELFNENESVRNQMVQTLIDNADEDIQNAITTLTNEITEKLNEVDGKIDGKIDELDGIKSTYTNQFNTLITDQTNTFNSNEEQRESKLDNAITTIQNADTTFKNGLQSDVHEFINTTDAEFEESQREREGEFNSTINSMNTQFNAAQSNRATTFNNSQTERNTQFNQSQTQRNTEFTTQMTNQQNEFDSKEAERDLATQVIINEHQALLDLDEKKANKDGYYVEMTTGFTEQLLSPDGITDEEPYIYRTSAGSTSISTGVAEIKSLYGNSIVWNQYFTPITWSSYGISATTTNYKLKVVGTSSQNAYVYIPIVRNSNCAGHKMLAIGYKASHAANDFHFYDDNTFGANMDNTNYALYTAGTNGVFWHISLKPNASIDIETYFQLYDLTKMFGAGNEPTTIEQFKSYFPLDYYTYNAGEIINVNVDGLKTVGFNAFDITKYTNKDAGAIVEENKLTFTTTNNTKLGTINIQFYKNGVVILDRIINNTFTVPNYDYIRVKRNGDKQDCSIYYGKPFIENQTYYFNGTITEESINKYVVENVCFNLSWSGYRNGDYEPYNEHNISIPVNEIKDANGNLLFPDGLKGFGNFTDVVTSDKAVKRYKKTTLHKEWINQFVEGYFSNGDNLIYAENIKSYITDIGGEGIPIINTVFTPCVGASGWSSLTTESVGSWGANTLQRLAFRTKMTKTQFDSVIDGLEIYYTTSTPIEVEFAETPQTFGEKLNLTYFVDDFGTEEFTTTEPTAPVKHSTFYMTNLRDKIRNIDGNTDSGALMNNSLTNLLSTLSNALGGTLTKVWDSNNKVWQFTFTPNQTNGGLNNE